jgi:anti-sigma B factor antagonist
VFRRWSKKAKLEETRLDTGDGAIHVFPGSEQVSVAVEGRISVDSSPDLRHALLGLLSRTAAPFMIIDLSGVTYLDMSGLATLLEALKAARERTVKLRMTGIGGEARNLVEIAQVETMFRAWGSEVEFQ